MATKRKAAPSGTQMERGRHHQGRVYWATEYAIRPGDKDTKGNLKSDSQYQPGYRAVIWKGDGTGILWSNEMPKANLDITPELAFDRLRENAPALAKKFGPIDLWKPGNEFVEMVAPAPF